MKIIISLLFVSVLVGFAVAQNQKKNEGSIKVIVSNIIFGEGEHVRVSNVPLKINAGTKDTEPENYAPIKNQIYVYVPHDFEVTIIKLPPQK